jgi:hypothetical protein
MSVLGRIYKMPIHEGDIEAVSTGRKIKVALDRRKSGHITISTPSPKKK